MLKVIEVALSQVGYLEKKSNKDLDDFTANAGTNNYTKYARDLDAIPDFYNGKKNGFAWCDVFIDWCFVQAYGVDLGKRLICQPEKSLGAGCKYSANYYKKYNQFHKTNPKVGDQIFFGNDQDVAHTGLVYKVDDSKVYTIEGNTSGASGVIANGGGVCKKSYSLSYSRIYGYGRPDYKLVDEQSSDVVVTKGEFTAELNTVKKGSIGNSVLLCQKLLYADGYKGKNGLVLELDGECGTNTVYAINSFQSAMRKKGIEVGSNGKNDGICGKKCWKALLELEVK